jgi:3D (Asp-Asp-Asp) domain-containing protein|tara:strand:+ start:953 stop:1315 length:363 start_codon:yes stop_codon:yes gene_type:complete
MKNVLTIAIILLSLNVMAQKKVQATVYNAVPAQTNNDPGHTAFMFELDLDDPYKHKIIAVSRDLLTEYPKGTKVYVTGTTYDGVYIVMDKMNKRYTNRIDLLINEEMQIGNWPNATITKL